MINSELLTNIFKNSPSPVLIFLPDAPNFTIVDSNDSFNEIFDKVTVLNGKNFHEYFDKDSEDKNLINSLKVVAEKNISQIVLNHQFKTVSKKSNSPSFDIKCVPFSSDKDSVELIICYFYNPRILNEKHSTPNIKTILKNNIEKDKTSEREYKMLFELSHIPKLVFDLDTLEILDANDTATEIYGYNRDELLTLKAKDLRPADEISKFKELEHKAKNITDIFGQGVFTHVKKDGSLIKVNVLGYKFYYEGKDCIMAECIDVTEREDALQLLKNNESKYINAQKIAKLGYWELDVKTFELYWSDEVYNIFGVDKTTFNCSLESYYGLIYPEDIQELIKANASTLEGLSDLNIEHRIMLPNEPEKWVKQKGKLVKDKNGDLSVLEGTVQDIDYEKRMELSLEETKNLYEYASRATSDFIWDWDLKTDNLFWGDGFKRLFGEDFKNNNDILISWKNRIHPDDQERIFKSIQKSINGSDQNWSDEYRILKSDNTYIHVLDKGFFLRDENGKAYRMVGAMQDISERKTLEVLLEKSNRLARIGSWEIDVLKGTVYWSKITKEIREADLDFGPSLALGMEFFKEGEHRNTISSKVKDCIENCQPWDEELQIITQKGNIKWIRTIGEPEIIEGKCVKIYGSFQDIDEKKNAEQELRSLYNERSAILESIGDAFFAVDKNRIITYCNNKAEEILGWKKDEAIGKTLSEINNHIEESIYQHYNDNESSNPHTIQFEILSTTNRWLDVNVYSSTSGLSIYLKDITDKKEAVEEIRLSNERFERISEASHEAIWDIDLSTNTMFLGNGFKNLRGEDYNKKIYGRENWMDNFFEEDKPRIEKLLKESLENKDITSFETEFYYIKENQSLVPISAHGSIIRNEQGIPTRIVGSFIDITIQKEYEKSLKKLNENLAQSNRQLTISNNELEQFAYVTSHDLQEPLRMVTAFLSQIEKKYSDIIDEKGKKYIFFAMDGAKRMSKIILDLLDFSKVGRLNHDIETIDLNKLLNDIIPLFKKKIEETNAKIVFDKLPTIQSYSTPLRQILQNLIGNSLKYQNKENPVIQIIVEELKEYWQFSVKDNGIGIKEEYFERIFNPFQRLHNREEYSGTGIGLTIVKKIVETLGGEIRVESKEGVGSTFIFTIKKQNQIV